MSRYRYSPGVRIPLESLQIGSDLRGMLISQVAVFLQRLVYDLFQLRRDVAVEANCRRRSGVKDGFEDQAGSLAAKGELPGRHLVQYRSEGEQVRARVQFLRPHL